MKPNIILAFHLCFYCSYLFGQKTSNSIIIDTVHFQLSPKNKHVVINGLSIGWTIHPWSTWQDTCFVKLNGINLEVGPIGLIGGLYGPIYGFVGVKDDSNRIANFFSNYGYLDFDSKVRHGTFVNGISLSICGIDETNNNGLVINGLSGLVHKTNGLQISGLINIMYEFKGASIALINNTATKGKGVQIGLINKCQTGQLVQIGLFNRIGKRVTPFINFRFRKEK